jgi:type I restriction-modification system DNA methylase subunit
VTKDEAKQKVGELVAKFESLSPTEVKKFNEANTKQTFILPLFEVLGWDIYDFNEVALEEAASNKRVDFAFKINGVARFYLEAKPLKADLNNPDYVKQAITYAYNNGVTWAVLTNFDEIRLFNAQNNKPFIQLNCKDFVTSFDKLWLLSRAIITTEAFNKEATQYGVLPPAIPIEERLFKQLRQWRENLFNELYHYNHEWLKEKQIDEVIQKLFNRLIFIRTAEDRTLEDKLLLAAVHQHKHGLPLAKLREIFEHYNGYYDSDLFKTHILDSDKLYVHETTLTEILNGLYEIPGGIADYDFSIIDADVLGRVYEQYLGYVASVVKEKAKAIQAQMNLGIKADTEFEVTAKKQRRKEQGIYYTPKFVTDFIVKETVGRFIKENEADGYDKILKMKILDPACGSGSFLIRAYDELLNYHARVRGKTANEMEQQDRMPILTRNIFGVDLDHQAVEIARLNLLLRGLAKRDHLPPLTDNIRQGNSLISGTEKELKIYFGKDWKAKHPFNWEDEFQDIMANGGFDVVIGNPPWVSLTGKHKSLDLPEGELQYLFDNYDINTYSPNLYEAFIWRAMELLKEGGYFSFIVPDRVATNLQFIKVRASILNSFTIRNLLFRFPFPGVIADTMIFVIQKTPPAKKSMIAVLEYPSSKSATIPQQTFIASSDSQFFFVDPQIANIFDKIKLKSQIKNLGEIAKSTSGCGAKTSLIHGKRLSDKEIKILKGENIGRYSNEGNFWFLFDDANLSGRTRDETKLGTKEKVLLRKTGSDIIATFVDSAVYPEQSLYFLYDADKETLLYLLALLNSSLMNVYYKNFAVTNRDTTPQLKNLDLDKFPIWDPQDNKDTRYSLITLVGKILELNKKLAPIKETYSNEREKLVKEIAKTDKEIDNLVYELYGLTEAERKIIEAST